MKKLLAAAAVGALALTGCGAQNSEAESETFTVGMECNYAPFNWQTTEATDTSVDLGSGAGYCDGYDVMIAQDIADDLGKELQVKKVSWAGLQPALESGEIDAIIAGMTADADREQGIDFTTPYYESEMVMIVREGSEEAGYTDIQQFSGHNVIGQKSTNYDTIIDQINGVNHLTPKETYPELVVALQSGDADAITAELPVAEGIVSANEGLTIVRFDEGKGFDVDTTVSIGLKEGTRDTDEFNAVQEALDKISEETRLDYMRQAVNNAPTSEE